MVVGLLLGSTVACGGSVTASRGANADAGDASVPAQDAANPPDSCVSKCKANACGMGDGCGDVCQCAAGVECIGGTCGGCELLANDFCNTSDFVDGSTPGTCCGVGDMCKLYGDANRCCGITGQGSCVRDTDCCDYANGARCNIVADGGRR